MAVFLVLGSFPDTEILNFIELYYRIDQSKEENHCELDIMSKCTCVLIKVYCTHVHVHVHVH